MRARSLRSMMERRAFTSRHRGKAYTPWLSGPRWRMAVAMRSAAGRKASVGLSVAMPAIPHIPSGSRRPAAANSPRTVTLAFLKAHASVDDGSGQYTAPAKSRARTTVTIALEYPSLPLPVFLVREVVSRGRCNTSLKPIQTAAFLRTWLKAPALLKEAKDQGVFALTGREPQNLRFMKGFWLSWSVASTG
jgi:hypothetical protein